MIDQVIGQPATYVTEVSVVGIPSGWSVIGLLSGEAHATETVHRLRELLPGDAFTPLPSTDIDPTLLPLADGPTFLRVIDSADAPDPELPPAA